MECRHASNHGCGEPIETSQDWLYTAFTNERPAAKPGRHTHRTALHASRFAVLADRVHGAGTRRDADAVSLPIDLRHRPGAHRVPAGDAGLPDGPGWLSDRSAVEPRRRVAIRRDGC